MRKYFWPILVIALALLVAGAWVAFPEARKGVVPAISSFCESFAAAAKDGWTRLFPPKEEPEVPDLLGDENVAVTTRAATMSDVRAAPRAASAVATALGTIADPASDPDPASITREQRKQRYKELIAAADQRKREVLFAALKKCPAGLEALKATRAYHAKVDEMKKLEAQHGKTDDSVALIRIELVHLKEAVKVANARYKVWKDAHPEEAVDPMADKLYCDLVARSRFFKD